MIMSHYDRCNIRGVPLITYEFVHAQWDPSLFAHIAEGKSVRGLTYPQRSYPPKKILFFQLKTFPCASRQIRNLDLFKFKHSMECYNPVDIGRIYIEPLISK